MSLITGTGMELLYANIHVGTAISNWTTEATGILNDTAVTGMGVSARIPADFWLPNPNSIGRGIKIVARGILSTNTAAPTYRFRVRVGASQDVTGPIILGMVAATASIGASSTNLNWELEGDVIMKTPGASGGANSVVCGVGRWYSAAGKQIINFRDVMCYGNATSPGTVSIQTDTTQYITVSCVCGTAAVANTVTLQQLLVFGLN